MLSTDNKKEKAEQSLACNERTPLSGTGLTVSCMKNDKCKLVSVLLGLCLVGILATWTVRVVSSSLRHRISPPLAHWPLVIDGKDAKGGPFVYSDSGFDKVLYDGLPFMLADSRAPDAQMLNELHAHCCEGFGMRGTNDVPLDDFAPACFQSMNCAQRRDAIEGVPEELLRVVWDSPGPSGRCPKEIHVRKSTSHEQLRRQLDLLTETYTQSLSRLPATSSGAVVAQEPLTAENPKLQALAAFLRGIAWLHPFLDGNGRFRTLLLQHEIRRLNFGPGAYMFNNNRDIFFESGAIYMAKIIEGIELAKEHWETGSNPWLDKEIVEKHLTRFQGPQCHEGGDWGSVLSQLEGM